MNFNLPEFEYYLKAMYECIENGDGRGKDFFMEKMNDIWFGSSDSERAEMDKMALEKINNGSSTDQNQGKRFKVEF